MIINWRLNYFPAPIPIATPAMRIKSEPIATAQHPPQPVPTIPNTQQNTYTQPIIQQSPAPPGKICPGQFDLFCFEWQHFLTFAPKKHPNNNKNFGYVHFLYSNNNNFPPSQFIVVV